MPYCSKTTTQCLLICPQHSKYTNLPQTQHHIQRGKWWKVWCYYRAKTEYTKDGKWTMFSLFFHWYVLKFETVAYSTGSSILYSRRTAGMILQQCPQRTDYKSVRSIDMYKRKAENPYSQPHRKKQASSNLLNTGHNRLTAILNMTQCTKTLLMNGTLELIIKDLL